MRLPVSSVETVLLDQFYAARPKPDLMKIDVEGAEGLVLEGARELLSRTKPMLLLELHPTKLRRNFGTNTAAVVDTIVGHGYRIHRFVQHRHDMELEAADLGALCSSTETSLMIFCE